MPGTHPLGLHFAQVCLESLQVLRRAPVSRQYQSKTDQPTLRCSWVWLGSSNSVLLFPRVLLCSGFAAKHAVHHVDHRGRRMWRTVRAVAQALRWYATSSGRTHHGRSLACQSCTKRPSTAESPHSWVLSGAWGNMPANASSLACIPTELQIRHKCQKFKNQKAQQGQSTVNWLFQRKHLYIPYTSVLAGQRIQRTPIPPFLATPKAPRHRRAGWNHHGEAHPKGFRLQAGHKKSLIKWR